MKQKTCNIEILCVCKFYVVPHGLEIVYLNTIFDWTVGKYITIYIYDILSLEDNTPRKYNSNFNKACMVKM